MAAPFGALRLFAHCCNFSSKVSFNFLNAFAHFKADEVHDISVVFFQQIANSFAWVHNEVLTSQRDFASELTHTAFNHLLSNLTWLAGFDSNVQLDLVLASNNFSRNIVWLNIFRLACSDVHSNVLNQFFISTRGRNHNTDTCAMQVSTQNVAFQYSDTANVDVLTDFSDQVCTLFFELSFQNIDISDFFSQSCVDNFFAECFEASIFSNEVSFAVQFQNHTVLTISGNFSQDDTFSSNTACFLGSFSLTRLTHVVDGQLNVTISFNQRLFTFHHACGCTLTQFFYQSSGNSNHLNFLGSLVKTKSHIRYAKGAYKAPLTNIFQYLVNKGSQRAGLIIQLLRSFLPPERPDLENDLHGRR
ncbi:conserved hypothetical protein [Yersinia pestis Pestoides F]|uniref:Uncharacterized protein n=3 Tax=Yersinia pestis TaxID=632 RepID=Q8CKQ1_YERPE|nr:hypothetical [Yersinia pestis KIM10+]ABG12487.1 conserved hypothetical protein [Yersinia pestis Antiqua]ABG19282.1 conserved hypothetical protein [Yersinia pestis Nepal516]ABP40052.1 conserved hypothetical protein [Yersinia pestis Pestoides F]